MTTNVKEIRAGDMVTCIINQTDIICKGKSININN